MLHRRHLLLAALAAPVAGRAAPYAADGPARILPGALKSNLLDLALAGSRLVAVGERGHVLLSDDAGAAWRQAKAVPTRTTLTAVQALDARTLLAVGHGGLVLRSGDAGETWALVQGKADGPDVLLAVWVDPASGRGLAVGGFGAALFTTDGGQRWQPGALAEGEAGERHANRIWRSEAGSWLVAAEAGHVLRSGDGAPGSFQPVKTPYAGSLWTGLALAGGLLLAGGMRGNLVRSSDDGRSWSHLPVADAGSFTGCTRLPDGRPLLVGVDGTLVLGDAGAGQFRLTRLDDRATLTGVLAVAGGGLVATTAAGPRRLDLPR